MANLHLNITRVELDALENRVNTKIATVEDYKTLDLYLSKAGLPQNYFLNQLSKNGIFSFEELQGFIASPPEPRNPTREGRVAGTVTGLILFLKNLL